MSSSCCEQNAAACTCKGSLGPGAAGKGPACSPVVFHISPRSPATCYWTAGKDVIPPIILQHTEPFELGREVTQPALLPGCCSRPPQDSDSEFRVVFLAAVRAKLEQRDHSHISPHANAGIVLGFFCDEYSISPMWEKITILLPFPS